ncbi:MAG: polysaccharide biosynthesis C-terminal domain-containing protein [Firmicutes bacterium]|nr:polysaccharide biosynthesis C-terminal domain-containing protein [Bacillota bacterium]
MSEQSTQKGRMAKDTIIYMAAKGIEGIVGIVTMSKMTDLFVPEMMGHYSTVNIAVTTAGMVFIQWLVQSVMRYINKYQLEKREESFYTTVFLAWAKSNVMGMVFTPAVIFAALGVMHLLYMAFGMYAWAAGLAFPIMLGKLKQVVTPLLLLLCAAWFVTYNTAQLVIAMLAALRKAKLNLLLSMITVCGRLGFMWLFCVLWGSRVEWIFLSYFITDGTVSLIGLINLRFFKYFNAKNGSKAIQNELKQYGMPLMGNMITTSVLNKSDIYIVSGLLGFGMAGIYQTNYSLIATAFTLLSASVMRGSYPTILRMWSEGKKELTEHLISDAVRMYLLLSVPAVLGVASVSDVVAAALFEKRYFEGNTIMFWVALGMMFLGLTEYSIKHWELTANTKAIFKRSLIGGIVNVVLNLVFIRVFKTYYVAAVTTFIGFFVYFLLARFGTRKYIKWQLPAMTYVRIIGSGLIMFAALMLIKAHLPYNKATLLLLVAAGAAVYGAVLLGSGEIKGEVKAVMGKLRKK